jgi:hypothetical protein
MTPDAPAAAPAAPAPAAPAPAAPAAPAPAAAPPAPAPAAPAAAAPAPARVAPEKYELKLPEGGHLNDDDRTWVEGVARQANWTNEEAQAALEEHHAATVAQSERYLALAKADKDYGGERLVETQRLALKAINFLRPDGHTRRAAFNAFVNRGGAGNHPEVLAFLADLGKLIGEDGAVSGRPGSNPPRTAEETLYGKPTT